MEQMIEKIKSEIKFKKASWLIRMNIHKNKKTFTKEEVEVVRKLNRWGCIADNYDEEWTLEKEFEFIPRIMGLHSVCIEGPSFGSNGAFVLQMGALHFYLRIFLYKNGVNYGIKAPGTIKKFVTGDGRAKKDLMLLKVYKKWGVEFDDDNLADAYSLARIALEEYKNGRDNSKDTK